MKYNLRHYIYHMKKYSLILTTLLGIISMSCNRDICIIEGHITGLEGDGWVYIQDAWNDYEVIDSTKAVNGIFRFELESPQTTYAYLYYNQEIQLHNFIIEPGSIKLQGEAEDAWMFNGTGTPMNDKYNALMKKLGAIDEAKHPTEEINATIAGIIRKEMGTGKGDEYRLLLIENSFTSGIHPVELLKCFETLTESLKSSAHAQEVQEYLYRLAWVYPQTEGSDIIPTFIDITYPDKNGNSVSLESIIRNADNKIVLLDFWATWCGPCRDEMPFIKSAYNQYHDKGFEIYAVSCDPNQDKWEQYIEDEQLEWVNVFGGNMRRMPEVETYALDGIPANILIDCSTGIIIGRDLRGKALIDVLNDLL